MTFESEDPQKIGRYETVLQIARGGMATVYLARSEGHGGFDRYVALKVTAEHLRQDPEFAQHLVEEAKLVAHLRHPNVVPVLDVGVAEHGAVFLVMEYVPGDTLGGLFRAAEAAGTVVPPRIGLRIVVDALAGLHAAHEHADEEGRSHCIVHRDFSPQNILVGTDGVARLTDFGIAKAASRVSFSVAGTLKGKLSYASPEQARGGNVDRRCDVWAAAVVAWEALAGRKLYPPTPRTLLDIVDQAPIRVRSVRPDVPQGIDEALAEALQLDVTRRPETAQDFARSLTAAARDADMLAEIDEVAAYVQRIAGPVLEERKRTIAELRRLRGQASAPASSPNVGFASLSREAPMLVDPLPAEDDAGGPTELVPPLFTSPLAVDYLSPAGHVLAESPEDVPAPRAPVAARVRAGLDRASRGARGAAAQVARFVERHPKPAIAIAATAGMVPLVAIVVLLVRGPSSPAVDPTTTTTTTTTTEGVPSTTSPGASPTAREARATLGTLGEAVASPARIEITANRPIARVRLDGRIVEVEVPAPKVEIDLEPDEIARMQLAVRVTSVNGHFANVTWEPDSAPLDVTFDESRPVHHPPKASGTSRTKKR